MAPRLPARAIAPPAPKRLLQAAPMPRKPRSRQSYAAQQVRRFDYDRYLCALFAPAARRDALFAVLAFNIEVAKTREAVTEPMLGQIRLQWWREAIAEIYDGDPGEGGGVRRHEVVLALADAIQAHDLPRRAFDRLIDAREFDLTDQLPRSLGDLMDYLDDTSAALFHLLALVLDARDVATDTIARGVGRVWGLTGLIRAIPFHARQQRCFIPQDVAESTGLKPRDVFDLKPTEALASAVRRLTEEAARRLTLARAERETLDPKALSAVLPAILAGRYLDRIAAQDFDVLTKPVTLGRFIRQRALWRAAKRGLY